MVLLCSTATSTYMDIPLKLNHSLPRSRFLNSLLRRRPISATLPDRLPTTPTRGLVGGGGVEREVFGEDRLKVLKWKLEEEGIRCDSLVPGKYSTTICPKCGGGQGKQRNFSLFIREDLELAMWSCFSDQCAWRGHVMIPSMKRTDTEATRNVEVNANKTSTKKAFSESGLNGVLRNQSMNSKGYRIITEESLRLEPLCEKLIEFFSERRISLKTLQRNGVMKRRHKDQIIITFPYRRNGVLISCKYRTIEKKFWQERHTEKIFYGIDDIKKASNVIIVEGEVDKLSMEEAGFQNCISVPNGAPQKASNGDVPSEEEDRNFQYFHNCKVYLEKVSRIILATDGDPPGQALAEELAKRLGAERCWRVRWPKMNDAEVCKDANQVLVCLGADALRDVIMNAEPWLQ